MGSSLYRVGDLVKHNTIYNGSQIPVYAKIIDIIDKEKSFYEMVITTGEGSNNTKVLLKIKTLAKYNNLSPLYIEDVFLDPHAVYLIDINYEKNLLENNIKKTYSRIDFLNINENREDKLNKILNEKN